jgi:hypothetical protein
MVIRCWQPANTPLLKEAIDASLDHLHPWLPWVENEPEPVAAKVQRLRYPDFLRKASSIRSFSK